MKLGSLSSIVLAAAILATPGGRLAAQADDRAASIARGRYLVVIAGCNDCHTPGYPEAAGKVPERDWLVGDRLGWRGPWGTTYGTNLRLLLGGMTEQRWVEHARTMTPRPPMPWFNLRAMSDEDLVAMHRYVVSLGPAGEATPAALPPGETPAGPFVQFPN